MSEPLQSQPSAADQTSAAPKRSKPVTSADIVGALARRYAPPGWAFFEQVARGTGSKADGWADAMALSLWPSRGIELYGFEVKISRGDWLRELKNPAKADKIAVLCHRWWIVAAPGCVQASELPPNWGLIELRSGKLWDVVQATAIAPKALDWGFLAALLRRVGDANVPRSAVDAQIAKALEERGARVEVEVERRMRRHDDLVKAVAEFERASGIKICQWTAGDQGRAVKLLASLNLGSRLNRQREALSVLLKQLDETLAELPPEEAADE